MTANRKLKPSLRARRKRLGAPELRIADTQIIIALGKPLQNLLWFSSVAALTAISPGMSSPRAQQGPNSGTELAHCYQDLREADGRGDFSHAAQVAEDCLGFLGKTMQTDPSKTRNGYYATYYLASALRKGKGVPIDELRAFDLLKSLADVDLDGDAALDLAEMYLNGNGTARDPVEAVVLVWRVAHGAWSLYSPYWGMCNNCDDLWKHQETLEHRLDRELTPEEREQARMREIDRFPDILARANHRDRQVSIATACVIFTIVAAMWWRTRPSKRSAVGRKRA